MTEALSALVEKSVVTRDPNLQPARYQLLETLRQYGRQRLRDLDEEVLIQARHRDWIVALTEPLTAFDARQADLFTRIHLEQDNLWAALDFCLRHPGEAPKGADICRYVWVYWGSRGPVGEAHRIVSSLLDATPQDGLPRASLFFAAAGLAINQNDFAAVAVASNEMLRIGRALDDSEIASAALMFQGLARLVAGDSTGAKESAESSLALARSRQLRPIAMGALRLIANIRLAAGDFEAAAKAAEEALELSDGWGEMWLRGYLLNDLAQAASRRGDLARAEALAREEVRCHVALDDRQGLSLVAEMLASMAAERAAYQRAATLFGCAQCLRERVGSTFPESYRSEHEAAASLATEALGSAAVEIAIEQGRAMTLDLVAAYLLEEKRPTVGLRPTSERRPNGLTVREFEIARLIADGLTTAQIAAKLFISERTVTTHVTNMLNKLGLSSRLQLASWVAAPQPASAKNT